MGFWALPTAFPATVAMPAMVGQAQDTPIRETAVTIISLCPAIKSGRPEVLILLPFLKLLIFTDLKVKIIKKNKKKPNVKY